MMRNIGILLVLLALICGSCDEKSEEPRYSGEIVLSSERLMSGTDWAFYGFSFETGKISIYSGISTMPDLTSNHLIVTTEIESVYLESSDDEQAFYKNGIFSTSAEAEAYFNNYGEVLTSEFQPLAEEIKENQVWTVQTASKRFAKIWIREITIQKGSVSDFADVRIKYQYQPDGSREFDCGCN